MSGRNVRVLVWVVSILLLAGCQTSDKAFVYSGTIEGTEIPIQSELGGSLPVLTGEEGQQVKAGELLARTDDAQVRLQVAEAKAAVEAAQAKWEEAKAGSRSEELSQAAAQLEQAQKVTQQAQAQIGSAGEQVASLNAVKEQLTKDLASIQETLRLHIKRLNQTKNAYDSGDATKDQIDTMNETVNQTQMQVNDLEARIKSTDAQIAQARHQLDAASAQRDQALAGQKAAEAKLALVQAGSTDYQLRNLLALKNQAESKLAEAQVTAGKSDITAPADGIILRKLVEKGEIVKPYAPIYTLLKAGELKIIVYVPEAQLGEVGIGQTAAISVDAYPGTAFAGKVTRISDKAEFTPKNVQTPDERTKMVFAVTVQVTDGLDKLKPGMPADVRFQAVNPEAKAK